ncbi:MAG TPA: hypothetical protein VJ756_22685 [Terriglobales bacterium]|nr:hypothetical protein [Terriglobales bacterium]
MKKELQEARAGIVIPGADFSEQARAGIELEAFWRRPSRQPKS